MSDIRKFMNIVESVLEDAISPDVETTDIESDDAENSKMSNKERATIALHYLIELDRFIQHARFNSINLAPRNTALRIFIDRADSFIKEAKAIIPELSGRPYDGPNIMKLTNKVNLVTPYDPNLMFRNEKGHFTAAKYSQDQIKAAIELIKKGVHLIADQTGDVNTDGFLNTVRYHLKHNNSFKNLTNFWAGFWPELKSDLEKISNP